MKRWLENHTPPHVQTAIYAILYLALLWAGTWFALFIRVGDDKITLIWVPTGITLGALLINPRRQWPFLLAGSVGIYAAYVHLLDVYPETPLRYLIYFGLIGTVVMGLIAELFLRFRVSMPLFSKASDIVWLATLLLVLLALGALASTLVEHERNPIAHFWHAMQLWWLSDVLGGMVVVPLILTHLTPPALRDNTPAPSTTRPWHMVEASIILMGLIVLCVVFVRLPDVAQSIFELPTLVFIFLIWAALRFSMRFNTTVLALLAVLFSVEFARGLGPFAHAVTRETIHLSAVSVQVYLLVACVAMLILATVVNERSRALADVRFRDARFNAIASALRPAIFMTTWPERKMLYASPAFHKITGITTDQAIGQTSILRTLVHPDDQPILEASEAVFNATATDEAMFRIVRPDGEERWLWAITAAITNSNHDNSDNTAHPTHLVGSLEDITERRRARSDRRALEEQLRESQKMETLGQLASGVAHDFNNLLAVISAHTDLVEEEVGTHPVVQNSLRAVHEAIDHASGVSRSLLTFSSNTPTPHRRCNTAAIIEQAHRMLARTLPATTQLTFNISPQLPPLFADPVQIQQVLVNLILNAHDALPHAKGKITVTAHTAPLPDNLLHDQNKKNQSDHNTPWILLAITDTGIGMPPDVLNRVFEPFYTTRGEQGGTGLGLSVVRRIINDHSGHIDVKSIPNTGTTFHVWLPSTTAGDTSPSGTTTQNTPLPPASGHILLAEDEPQIRAILAGALEDTGYTVVQVSDGNALLHAFENAAASATPFDLLLTDIDMPCRSGLDSLRQLRQQGHQLPAILISGSVDLKIDPRREGDTTLVNKPFNIAELCQLVRERQHHAASKPVHPPQKDSANHNHE